MKMLIGLFFISMSTLGYTQAVQDFTLTNVVDGKSVSLSGFTNCTGLVLVFTSNECPYDGYYRDRLRDLVNQYQGQIQFVFVNASTEPEESAAQMKTAYPQWNIPVPYLADKDQVAMECVGARKSPEVFLLKNNKGSFQQVYHGAIDDNPQVATDVSKSYLKESMDQLLAGHRVTQPSVRAVGCTIRKK